jgi:pimeloyl-ACP methyl ester carboxylesterase
LSYVHPNYALQLSYTLFSTPRKGRLDIKKLPKTLQNSKIVQQEFDTHKFYSYIWEGTEDTILLVHGWESNASRWKKLISHLKKTGKTIIAIDAPGHGKSEGKYINILIYKDAIEHIIKALGPIDHFMGHSLGGITLAMIAENIENPINHKFVLIAPATKTTTTFDNYFNMMRFSAPVKEAFYTELKSRTSLPVTFFEADRAIENYPGEVLWVHDQGDRVCPYQDLVNFKNKAPKNIKFMITNDLGHNKVYKTPAVIHQIVAFLTA